MNCSVCGGEIRLWARLTSRLENGVCKKCQEQGGTQLQVLVQSVSAAQSFNVQYAERWANQLEETVRKYRIPESEALPFKLTLLNNMLKLVEAGNELVEADLKFLLELGQKYDVRRNATPELGGLIHSRRHEGDHPVVGKRPSTAQRLQRSGLAKGGDLPLGRGGWAARAENQARVRRRLQFHERTRPARSRGADSRR